MSADHEFEFKLNVSTTGFTSKPPKGDEKVGKLKFQPCQLTIEAALQCALKGKAFCYTFATSNPKGVISMTDKTEANFLGTSVIIYDFDGMDTGMEDFIASLNYKPSFAYQSYSNGEQGCGYRFRLAYVLDSEVHGVHEFNTLYHAIANANHFVKEVLNVHGGWDVRNVSQFYYGTSSTAATYKGEAIYTQEEFTPFIVASTEPDKHVSVSRSVSKNKTKIAPEFLKDFTHLPDKVMFAKYREVYYPNYKDSLSTPLLLDESGMFFRYPDDYVCVKHKRRGRYTHRWEIGENRKKKMYITAQIMLFNTPSLTIENLLYNLRIERQWYYVTDDKINNEFLIQTAISAFNKPYPLEPSKHPSFSLNKVFWVGKGYTLNQAKMIVRGYLKAKEVERLYNPSLSRKENLRVLKENGVIISDKTLQRMVTRGDIKIVKTNGKPTYLSCCPDDVTIQILSMIYKKPDVTQREIASHLGVCVRTVKRYMTEMKDLFIERFGDNHDGRWYLQPHGEYVLERHMFQISQGN